MVALKLVKADDDCPEPIPLQSLKLAIGEQKVWVHRWLMSDGIRCRKCSTCTLRAGGDGRGMCVEKPE